MAMETPEYHGIFDTHAHYNDHRYDEDREELLGSLPEQGVSLVLEAGCDVASNEWGVEYSQKYPYLYCSVGIHPSEAGNVSEGYLERLEQLAKHPKVMAIGEIGLDYHYPEPSHEIQLQRFEEQLMLARDLDLPVMIHDRDAHGDTMELLRRYHPRGIVHCFSGSREMAAEIVKLGMYLGFTGVLTFSNARRALEAVDAIPLDRLVLETDCPYMAPVPFRGQRCDSRMIVRHAAVMAQIKGVDTQRMIDIANENGRRVYGMPD